MQQVHENENLNIVESNASMCFIDKVLVQQHKLALVKKTTLVTIEIIDD
jgi:hypothetical protein